MSLVSLSLLLQQILSCRARSRAQAAHRRRSLRRRNSQVSSTRDARRASRVAVSHRPARPAAAASRPKQLDPELAIKRQHGHVIHASEFKKAELGEQRDYGEQSYVRDACGRSRVAVALQDPDPSNPTLFWRMVQTDRTRSVFRSCFAFEMIK